MSALQRWEDLYREVNRLPPRLGAVGVRDPDGVCEAFDGNGYDGMGRCHSDGHYLCVECSELAPDAPRFVEYDRDGRRDRLRAFWTTLRMRARRAGGAS